MGQVSISSITKAFGDFTALDNVSLGIAAGSIHAILGENGAGKTSLMNILYGLYQPDAGEIRLNGQAVRLRNPSQAIAHRIGMVHQHFMLIDTLTVTENIVLGLAEQKVRLRLSEHAERIANMGRYYGFDVDPDRVVRDLPVGMQQRVEILKALYREANILILDEPTSVLAPSEVDSFLRGVRVLRDKGCTVIFITHKLEEVIAVADRVSVLRHGQVVAEHDCADVDARQLARLMVGRDVLLDVPRASRAPGDVLLEVRNLSASANNGASALTDISFELRAGEVLGVAGVDGNGQVELAEAICGLRPLDKGRIVMEGRDISALDIEQRRRIAGLGLVPEDRHRTGLVLDYPAPLNLALRAFNHPPFSHFGILDTGFALENAKRLVDDYDIRLRDLSQPVRHLSGGNQQK